LPKAKNLQILDVLTFEQNYKNEQPLFMPVLSFTDINVYSTKKYLQIFYKTTGHFEYSNLDSKTQNWPKGCDFWTCLFWPCNNF